MTPRVVTLGETMIQLSPGTDSLGKADALAVGIGGAESNLACYLAASGTPVTWVSALGDDPFGDRVHAAVAAYGVEVSLAEHSHRSTGVYVKDPRPAGTRVHYYRSGSAASALSPVDLARMPLSGAGVLHLTGITPALSASCADLVDAAMATARAEGVVISFDVNMRPSLWPDAATAANVLRRFARAADIVFVGRDEAEALWGTPTADEIAAYLEVGHLVVKDGEVGATSFVAESDPVFVPAPVVDVVEPDGAGDAFAAGYLRAMLGGAAEADRLVEGHRFAALALGSHGDLPSPELVRAALSGVGAGPVDGVTECGTAGAG
ncbi:sugar kinase [Microbacterium sp. bgisy203]|uniref:sugar kinase n=1 Tax=Microbacterium sp. bgisy203 TaxID=3413799 RepID=UPI003D730BB2